ncbi:MAG: hypothetical protein CME70_21510 [Halobacteriovorax sp.]|nr:hypothetical protein [Halobacteriovorax sp.]|tara:strand:+ start:3634 stop:4350 length:717 start_codon:yes stop_codon:yes gene_type:complete
MKIGVFSVDQSPFLGRLLKELSLKRIPVDFVIFDEKSTSSKDKEIFNRRTEGKFQVLPYEKFDDIKFYSVSNHNSEECINILKDQKVDLMLNASTPRILKSEVLQVVNHGVLNMHPGFLPGYRGCSCVEWALKNFDPIGVSIHFMSEEIDKGPIVIQEKVNLLGAGNYSDIRTNVYNASISSMAKAVELLVMNGLKIVTPPVDGGTYYKPISDEIFKIVSSDKHIKEYLVKSKGKKHE